MTDFIIWPMLARLFDGEGGAEGAQAAEAPGETQEAPETTRRGKTTGETKVLYGKQPQQGSVEDAAPRGETEPAPDPEEKKKAFQTLIRGEYKDQYTEATQALINKRFGETKALQQQIAEAQPLLDLLASRYNVQGNVGDILRAVENDKHYLEAAADEAGVTVEQFREIEDLKRQKADFDRWKAQRQAEIAYQQRMERWNGEAQEVQKTYKGFELQQEVQNPAFLAMLRAGVPMKNAYESVHHEELMAAAQQAAAKQMERNVAASVRANGQRPQEAGMSSQPAFTVKSDPSKLSKQDFAEIRRRIERGEMISF
uniref:Scaffolding protein n=1 Tax=Podoviridae sp. ct6BA50 TaxID=2825221 RepID=A0A8S5VG25_9CAUD|nr:MAG TPA: hypothetical protein [Podoviridae sp. ct6BA50]